MSAMMITNCFPNLKNRRNYSFARLSLSSSFIRTTTLPHVFLFSKAPSPSATRSKVTTSGYTTGLILPDARMLYSTISRLNVFPGWVRTHSKIRSHTLGTRSGSRTVKSADLIRGGVRNRRGTGNYGLGYAPQKTPVTEMFFNRTRFRGSYTNVYWRMMTRK
jgi:hypothetical protein